MSTPDLLMIESDHDMRNSADLLVLNKLAKAIFAVPGIADVQSITRPEGTQIAHTSIPYLLSMGNASQLLNLPFQKARMEDMLKQADDMAAMISLMQRMYGLMQQMVATTHHIVGSTHDLQEVTGELRDHFADHPVLGPMDGYQWLVANARHVESHAGHIREIRSLAGFPREGNGR